MTSNARHIADSVPNVWQLISKGTLDPDDTAVSALEIFWSEDFERVELIGCFRPTTDGTTCRLRLSSDGATFVSTSTYKTGTVRWRAGSGADAHASNNASHAVIAHSCGHDEWDGCYSILTIDGINRRTDNHVGQNQSRYQDSSGVERCYMSGFRETTLADIKGIQIDFGTGNIDSYNYILRGQL